MKKVLLLLLTAAMLIQSISVAAEDAGQLAAVETEGYSTLKGMGVVTANPEEGATRGEFVELVCRLVNITQKPKDSNGNWNENFYGEFESSLALIENDNQGRDRTKIFEDVTESDENYENILYAYIRGWIEGKNDSYFHPDEEITKTDAAKILVDMLGYKTVVEMKGGYPQGYISAASELGLFKGIKDTAEKATYNEIAAMIYNAFDVRVLKTKWDGANVELSNSESESFLNALMHVDYIRDRLTDNGVTAINGSTEISPQSAKIGNGIYNYRDVAVKKAGRKLIGQCVKAYYSIDDDSPEELIYVTADKKNTLLTIKAEELEGFQNGTFSYLSNNKTKTAKVTGGAYLIYNGIYQGSYGSETFDFDNGTITLATGGNDNYDLIIVEKYDSWYVEKLDTGRMILYNAAHDTDPDTNDIELDFSQAYEEETLSIEDQAGEEIAIADLGQYTAFDIARNANVVKMIVSNHVISEYQISNTYSEDGKPGISNGTEQYLFDEAFLRAEKQSSYSVGETTALVINSFGKILWIERNTNGYDLEIGYFLKGFEDVEGGEDACFIQLLDKNQTKKQYKLEEKVRFGDRDTVERTQYKKIGARLAIEETSGLTGFFAYRVNEQDCIDLIELPLTKRGGTNRLQVIYDNRNESDSSISIIKRGNGFAFIGEHIFFDNNTTIWATPGTGENYMDADYYKRITDLNYYDTSSKYRMIGYATNQDTLYAKWIDQTSATLEGVTMQTLDFFVVTDVSEGLDAYDKLSVILEGFEVYNSKVTAKTLYVNADEAKAISIYNLNNVDENTKRYDIKKGDIIKYVTGALENSPKDIVVMFNLYAQNPASPGGAPGMFPESSGIYDKNDMTFKNNPFGMDYVKLIKINPRDYLTMRRFMYGCVYSLTDHIAKITTQDLTQSRYMEQLGTDDEIYTETNISVGIYNFYTISISKKSIHVRVGMLDDVRPYTEYSRQCSKMLSVQATGVPMATFCINWEE